MCDEVIVTIWSYFQCHSPFVEIRDAPEPQRIPFTGYSLVCYFFPRTILLGPNAPQPTSVERLPNGGFTMTFTNTGIHSLWKVVLE